LREVVDAGRAPLKASRHAVAIPRPDRTDSKIDPFGRLPKTALVS
jgi:hypothetical protein